MTARIEQQFKYYTFLCVLYAMCLLVAQTLAYRMLQVGDLLLPGGIFIFPASYTLGDILAEVYGYSLSRRAIYYSMVCQLIFSIVSSVVIHLPYPQGWNHYNDYITVFGSTWLVLISNVVAIGFGMLVNTYSICKTKVLVKGRFFAIRSFFASSFGELITTGIIVCIALVPVIGLGKGFKIFWSMFLFKTAYAAVAMIPAAFLANYLKRLENADIYETNLKFSWDLLKKESNIA